MSWMKPAPIVMAGLGPAIGRGTLPLRMAGTSQDKPGHDGEIEAKSEPGLVLVSYRLTLDAFCKKSVAIEMPQCHPG
jgi:hypothetical protein